MATVAGRAVIGGWPYMPTATITLPGEVAAGYRGTPGIPAGTALSEISTNYTLAGGAEVSGLRIAGDLIVSGKNSRISNSRVYGKICGPNNGDIPDGFVASQCDIGLDACPASPGDNNTLVRGGAYSLLGCHLHNWCADILALHGGTGILVQDCLIDNMCMYDGDHLDAAQYYAPGSTNNSIQFVHNTIRSNPVNAPGEFSNSCFFFADNWLGIAYIRNNYLSGGTYPMRFHESGKYHVTGNVIEKGSYQYGAVDTAASVAGAFVEWSGNTLSDGTPLNL